MPPEACTAPGSSGTLLLSRADVASLVELDDVIREVERAFAMHADGAIPLPGMLGCPVGAGGFHIKSAWLPGTEPRFAVKTNANFPGNRESSGLPTIQGVIGLFDGATGAPLAVMDSIEITILRTAAATAVAVSHCAREGARAVTIFGCGDQAAAQIRALARVRPVTRVFACDLDVRRAERLAETLSDLALKVDPVLDPRAALAESDICVTCTTSTRPFLGRADLAPGTFVAAVGADSEAKQELEADLVASAVLVVDLLESCAAIGELHHALEADLMQREDVHAELGEVVTGRKAGRTTDEEIVVFDSTGSALQDVVTAELAYGRAIATGVGTWFRFLA
jgi:ornithine cyclodeaminase/alanine dehydrogenase-like protein (mu-crystallin family)